MTFFDADLDNITGYVTTRRERGYSSLELRARHIRFRFDSVEMQADVRERWENRRRGPGGQLEFLGAYLADRFVAKIRFIVSDESLRARNEPVTIPFTYHYPLDYRPGRWPIQWVESDLWPFSKIYAQSFNEFDLFDLGSEWLFSGGAHEYVESEELDVNERERFLLMGTWYPLPGSGIDTVQAVINIVDTANEDAVVATFEREWQHSFEEVPSPLTRETLER